MSDHPANPNQRSEPTRPSRANFLLGLRNSRICRAGVALLVAEAFAEAMHTPLRALPPRQPPLLRPRPTLLSCGGRRRRTRVVRRRTSLRSASDIDPASDRSSLSRRDGRHTLRPAGPATRCASDDASSLATARLWPRGTSSPAATNAVDAQPAVSMTALSSPRVLHLLRRVVRRLAPHGASQSQKQARACCWPGDSAAVASGISLRAAARLEGARDPQSCRSGSPVQSKIGPMIPAYDFSPVGEGVTFLPKGNREGSCARSRLHDSTDLECRGPVS